MESPLLSPEIELKPIRTFFLNLKIAGLEIFQNKIWAIFNLCEYPFTVFRMITVPNISPDFYSKQCNVISFFLFPLFTSLMLKRKPHL